MEVPIRVVARVKPCLPEDERCLQVAPASSQIVLGFDNFCDFDAVFGEDVSQKELYNTCLADMVGNFFQGFNTTVLSYGQKGSGKTYTMTGPDFLWAMNEEEFGLVPQAVRHIFKMMNEIPEREYRVHISYLIINQEAVYDLLASGQPLSPLNVLEDNVGNVVIPGLTVVDCSNISEVLNCLEAGLLHRHSASSQGFDLSSAHTMFNFTLEHQWSDSEGRMKYLYSRISFVDLAGTDERKLSLNYNDIGGVSNSLKNNLFLNSDLKTLTNVLQCLVNKNYRGVIPYRDSRLTHILKDSFGGNSITLMVCCLSPLNKDYNASFDTLKIGSLTRYAVNFPSPNIILQNSLQSLSSNLPSNLTNVWSSRQSNCIGNLSSTSLSQNASLKSVSLPQQPQPSTTIHSNPSYQTYQQHVINGYNYPTLGNIDKLPLQDNDFIFKVQFAASQWHLLVSNAEDLLASILQAGCVSPSDKSKIQSWLCMKAEADECIGSDIPPLQPEAEGSRPLEVIEELSEPNEGIEGSPATHLSESEVSSSVSSLGEEFYNQLELLRERFFVITSNFIREAQNQYLNCNKICETLSERNSLEAATAEDAPLEKMSVSENSSLSSLSGSNKSSGADRGDTKEHGKEVPPIDIDAKCSLSEDKRLFENILTEKEDLEESNINCDSDKENLASNFGSRLSLISKTSSASSSGNEKSKKKKTRVSKRRERMVEKFRRMSSIGKGSSSRRESKIGRMSSRRRRSGPTLVNDSFSSSAADVDNLGKEGEVEDDGIGASSEKELLRKVSSKIVSVSKGPSKCVINLKTKSCQLKRSIRSHIFRKKNKENQIPMSVLTEPCTSKTSQSTDLPCSVRLVSDDLKVARERLEELSATIKVKEAFIHELKMSGTEAEATRKRCEVQMKRLQDELQELSKSHQRAQNKMGELTDDEDEKAHYRNKVLECNRKISNVKKRISSLEKVASISKNDDIKVKELEKSIQELRQEQEELHTKLREEIQRKEQLEQQILRENRCARNPLCSSSKIMDEEDSDREVEIDSTNNNKKLKEEDSHNFVRPGNEPLDKLHRLAASKKRKLASSTGDSQSETSIRGSRKSHRDKRKSGRYDKSLSDPECNETSLGEETIRREIGLLRNARDNLIVKRQKIDKRIKKGRTQGDGREDERKLLEYDEAVEGLDAVIERKNEVLSGKAEQVEPTSVLLLTKNDLEERLNNLPIAELHFLLFKYFSRIIDLRIEFRRQELAFAELENQYDEQGRFITNLKAAYQQASLEMERRVTSLQREYQYKISYLLRQFNDDTTGQGVQEMKVLEMEQQLYYYKKLSRELKDKLREYLSHGSSRPARECEPVPGPSGIKNHRVDPDPMNTFLPRRSDPSPPITPQAWPRRGRRFAMHNVGNCNTTKVTRQKNKLIIQQNGESKHNG